MKKTRHLTKRMSQRGIQGWMIDIVNQFGKKGKGDKLVLDRKELERVIFVFNQLIKALQILKIQPSKNQKIPSLLLQINLDLYLHPSLFKKLCQTERPLDLQILNKAIHEITSLKSKLAKIRDKGGIILVEENGKAITVYNKNSFNKKLRPKS